MKSEAKQKVKFQFEAVGTHWQIDADIPLETRSLILACIDSYDRIYSRFRHDSIVSLMARQGGSHVLQYSSELLKLYEAMYRATGGLVTPLIGQTLVDAGYDAVYSLRPNESVVAAPKWEEVLDYVNGGIALARPALLDFGAAGKGQLVDLVSDIVAAEVSEYCIDAGGDMKVAGSLRVGLEHPDDATKVIGVAELNDQSLCGSAGNRRAWGKYHHIINPVTVQSSQHVSAVWTVASSTMVADGMATCLFFVSPAKLLKTFEFEYVMLFADGHAEISPNFPGFLF